MEVLEFTPMACGRAVRLKGGLLSGIGFHPALGSL